ncbi:MAG: hypothetical protein NTV49_06545 [Kiritimatiellaeota bacterium]|nr:hypothetical protein [Kiritimatiellota bacterium]
MQPEGSIVGEKDTMENGGTTGMSGFIGNVIHSLDSKKRLTIPADWREMAGAPPHLVVLPSVTEKCLWVYPERIWNLRLESLRAVSSANEAVRQAMRVWASQSERVSWDAQGRIRIKDELLGHAELSNQVVLVGAFERMELWEPDLWKQQVGSVDQISLKKAVQSVGL